MWTFDVGRAVLGLPYEGEKLLSPLERKWRKVGGRVLLEDFILRSRALIWYIELLCSSINKEVTKILSPEKVEKVGRTKSKGFGTRATTLVMCTFVVGRAVLGLPYEGESHFLP